MPNIIHKKPIGPRLYPAVIAQLGELAALWGSSVNNALARCITEMHKKYIKK